MKVLLRTYGCRANQYDSEAIRAMLEAAGAEETGMPEEADAAIFNSCSVTAAAESDLRADVRRVARLNPRIRSVIVGCAPGSPARDETRNPLRTLPAVADVIPGSDTATLAVVLGLDRSVVQTMPAVQTGARALLRIQDGCDEHCTFCAATLARGNNRSRPAGVLVAEAAALAQSHPEIVITGIHIGSYGTDFGSSLGELMAELISRVPEVRFRLSSLEATEVDETLRQLLSVDARRLAPYLHAPLQSGSNSVLKCMGRHWYDAERYAAAVERIVDGRTGFALCADVITGFPGETEADHRATMSLVERLPFTSLHVFPFSARPGTAALRLPGQVTSSVSAARAAELGSVSAARGRAHARRRASGMADVVMISRGEGLTEDYLPVTVPDLNIPRRARFDAFLALEGDRLIAAPVHTRS